MRCATHSAPLPQSTSWRPVYVFSHDAGVTPWRPDYLSLAYGRLSGRRSGCTTCATTTRRGSLAAGVPGDDREQTARPHQPAITLNTYGHWLPEQDRDAADIIVAARVAGSWFPLTCSGSGCSVIDR